MRKLTLIAVLSLAAAIPASAQAGNGANYGTRDPKPCPPAKFEGPPSAEQASQLVACTLERATGAIIYLVSDVVVQVASDSRAFQAGDANENVDDTKPVYPIQGSFISYACHLQYTDDATHTNVGKNCSILQQPHAQGVCYRNTSGEWACRMRDRSLTWVNATNNVAPPEAIVAK